jgi:hypothetical protein
MILVCNRRPIGSIQPSLAVQVFVLFATEFRGNLFAQILARPRGVN